jgi:4-aminobutyrate aminotransferase
MARTRPLIGEVRGRGLLLGVDLVTDPESRAPAAEAAERVMYAALANGLSFKTSMGNVLVLSPPLTITAAEMHTALDILQAAIDAAARGD